MTSKNNVQVDELGKVAGIFLVFVLFVFTFPVVIFSGLFSYLVWVSFYEKEERKWIRSIIIAGIGFYITMKFWQETTIVVPTLISTMLWKVKIERILSTSALKNVFYLYPIILGLGFYLFENKSSPSFKAYYLIKKFVNYLYWPMHAVQIAFNLTIDVLFGILLRGNKIEKGSILYFITLILSALASSFFVAFIVEGISKRWGFSGFFNAVGMSYLVGYWYLVIVHGREKELAPENYINDMKNNSGVHIGRVTSPKRLDLNLSWRDINHHIHILGQPGAGKSVLLKNIYAHQVMSGEGLLMLDLKADYKVREDFISLCKFADRDKDFVLIDLSHPEKSYGYNPLLLGNATELKDKIIGSFEWSEPYYKKVAERTLLTVLKGIVWIRDNKKLIPSLEDLLVSISSVQGLTVLAGQVENEAIRGDIHDLAAGFDRSFIRDLESLRTELALLTKAEFGSIFKSSKTLDIYSAIMEKKVILVNLDGQTYNESAKKFGRLLLADLRAASGAIVTNIPEAKRPRFTVIVDEFSDIVATEDMARTFVGFLNRCRGSGIGVIIAHQSLGDFKDKTVRSQIIDSTETLFSFVQKDPETCEILASVIGTKEVYTETKQTKEWIFGDDNTGMGTKKLVQEYIYHPNVFKNLDMGEAIYAAKKPSRFGTVQVKMLEIPQIEVTEAELKETILESSSLDLHSQLNSQKEAYISAIQSSSSNLEKVEI